MLPWFSAPAASVIISRGRDRDIFTQSGRAAVSVRPMNTICASAIASVPFDFDVHAMIYTDDAPSLEKLLHDSFDDLRVNRVNLRKEFFRLPLERIREIVTQNGLTVEFTMMADAREYRESVALLERAIPLNE